MVSTAPEWQQRILESLLSTYLDQGGRRFNRDQMEDLLKQLAGSEAALPPKDRLVGYGKVAGYGTSHMTRFLNRAKRLLPEMLALRGLSAFDNPDPGKPTTTDATGFRPLGGTVDFDPLEVSVVVTLDKPDYPPEVVAHTIGNFLAQRAGDLVCLVQDAQTVGPRDVDLLLLRNYPLAMLYDALDEIPWVTAVATRPAEMFGEKLL